LKVIDHTDTHVRLSALSGPLK